MSSKRSGEKAENAEKARARALCAEGGGGGAVSAAAYLGQKGYSIWKRDMTEAERHGARSDLTVKPVMPKMVQSVSAFPVYKESVQKLYVPLYWGAARFGWPSSVRVPDGDDISLEFAGSMREYQEAIVGKYMAHIGENAAAGRHYGGGLFDVMTGSGKTVMALNVISRIRKKTLIIVHKSFLLHQWLERIEQFLPGARVGRIQGEVMDIEGKDIVIGMLQSLSMKDYHEDTFASFGMLICDEVHHLSAEVFVRALQRIVVRYTLGLSATMQRKDGLSKVFKMFLGEVLHKDKRTNEHAVLVRACHFRSSDAEFNEVRYDWRGNPMYSTMISKLCSFLPRADYVLELVRSEFARHAAGLPPYDYDGAPPMQMMVMAHNKSLLVYLHKTLVERFGHTSVGYYLGGMKERDLKVSEDKTVILATYAMASEGLDIKTLTTLVMATPKTDVTQSVGRILRTKGHRPVVLDVVDGHGLFQGQWRKRAAFYRKSKYRVEHVGACGGAPGACGDAVGAAHCSAHCSAGHDEDADCADYAEHSDGGGGGDTEGSGDTDGDTEGSGDAQIKRAEKAEKAEKAGSVARAPRAPRASVCMIHVAADRAPAGEVFRAR